MARALELRTPTLQPVAARRVAAASWLGGPTTAASGETLNVFVSASVPDPGAIRQQWADFFAGLPHGAELSLLNAYIVDPTELGSECVSSEAIGCYGGGHLVIPFEAVRGVDPGEIARHEYGHHIAANRSNAPWQAIDWGPKRWASVANVCAQVAAGTEFPGDEGSNYRENPGEAFAEVYRLLSDQKAGSPGFGWPVVDSRFYPDQAALAAAEQDVVAPWVAPTISTARARFVRGGQRTWTLTVATPLDGSFRAALTLRRGSLDRLTVLTPDGKVLAAGLWSAPTVQNATFSVCGQRSLLVRVVGDGRPGRFAVTTTVP